MDEKLGFAMSWIKTFDGNMRMATMSRIYAELHKMACAYAREHFPDFPMGNDTS